MSIPLRALCVSACAVALAGGLSACGSSSAAPNSGSTASSSGSSAARYQARLNLAKCFRAHGVNVPDPSSGGGPAGGGGVLRALRSYPPSQTRAATQACQTYIRQAFAFANLSPAQIAQFRQQFVKFAECMRAHGVNIPDPTNNGGGIFGLRGALSNVDRNSPAFQSALSNCQSLRPKLGPGGGGAAPVAPGA